MRLNIALTMRRLAAGIFTVCASTALSACAISELANAPKLPESPDVATAPWPRLADGPAPAPTAAENENNVAARAARGERIRQDLTKDATAATESQARLQETPVNTDDLASEVAKLRREAEALRNTPVE